MKKGRKARFLALLLSLAAFAGCASKTKPQEAAFDPKLAGTVTVSAGEAAVAKPGTKVCRWVQLGIAELDLIRGVVLQEEGHAVRVRIEDPGRFPNSLSGTPLARGALVLDKAIAWTPCVF
jgi:hypothetical protein